MDNSKQAFPLPGQSGMPNQMAGNPGAMPMGGNYYNPQPGMQMPQMQPMQQGMPMPQNMQMQPGMDPNQPVVAVSFFEEKKELLKTIGLAVLGLFVIILAVLFILKDKDYSEIKADIEGQINVAVADAVDENTTKLENEFAEREKSPNYNFTGPEDYGALSFSYPKTWNLYVESDASKGGDYVAYFNPGQVDSTKDKNSIYALKLTITTKTFEKIVEDYQKAMSRTDANLNMHTITINNAVANRYTGTLPGTEFNGYIVVIKIRDKTAILETDSYLFEADYNKLIDSITFNS